MLFPAVLFAMPLGLILIGSPIYGWRAPSDLSNFVSDGPTTISIVSVVLHFLAWASWLLFVRFTASELIRPGQSNGLGSTVFRRMLIATGVLATTIGAVEASSTVPEVSGVDNTPLDLKNAATPTKQAPQVSLHTVAVGESWVSLAQMYMSDPAAWSYIRSLNMNTAVDDGAVITTKTEIIKPGWKLRVPKVVEVDSKSVSIGIDSDGAFERDASSVLTGLGVAGSVLVVDIVEALRTARRRRSIDRNPGEYISEPRVRPSGYEAAINRVLADGTDQVLVTEVPPGSDNWPSSLQPTGELQLMVSRDRAIDLGKSSHIVVGGFDLSCGQFLNSAILQVLVAKAPLEVVVSPACKAIVAKFDQVREIDLAELRNLICSNRDRSSKSKGTVVVASSVELEGITLTPELCNDKDLYVLEWDPTKDAKLDLEFTEHGEVAFGGLSINEQAQRVTNQTAEVVLSLIDAKAGSVAKKVKPANWHSSNTLMLHVLGPVRLDGNSELTQRQLSLVTYLVVNGPSSRSQLKEALWDGQRVTDKTFSNLVSETRAKLGREFFPTASQGMYQISGISSDLDSLRELMAAGPKASSEQIEAGLELIGGEVFSVASTRHWSWISYHSYVYAEAEACVVDLTVELASRHVVAGDFHAAFRALKSGLVAVKSDERLTARMVEVCETFGKQTTADRIRQSWQRLAGEDLREDIFRTKSSVDADALDSDYAQATN